MSKTVADVLREIGSAPIMPSPEGKPDTLLTLSLPNQWPAECLKFLHDHFFPLVPPGNWTLSVSHHQVLTFGVRILGCKDDLYALVHLPCFNRCHLTVTTENGEAGLNITSAERFILPSGIPAPCTARGESLMHVRYSEVVEVSK